MSNLVEPAFRWFAPDVQPGAFSSSLRVFYTVVVRTVIPASFIVIIILLNPPPLDRYSNPPSTSEFAHINKYLAGTYDPELHTKDVKLLPFFTKRLVQERIALSATAPAETIVQPQPERPAVSAANAQELGLTEHAVVVGARVRKCLETDALGR